MADSAWQGANCIAISGDGCSQSEAKGPGEFRDGSRGIGFEKKVVIKNEDRACAISCYIQFFLAEPKGWGSHLNVAGATG